MYLEFLEGEATASSNAAVVLDGRASHDGPQLVNRARSDSSGLGKTGLTTTVLPAGLQLKRKNRSCQLSKSSSKL